MEKFLFDTNFDAEKTAKEKAAEVEKPAEPEEPVVEEPPAPTFNEEELEAARQAAFAEGKAAGFAEAEAAQDKRLADTLETLPPEFARLSQDLEAQADDRRRETLDAAITVVRKLFPHLAREHGLDEIGAVIKDCLERLRDEPRLVIRSADADLDALKERVEQCAAQSGFQGKLVFLADERLAAGDLRVEWADGGAERDQAGLWQEIDAIIARALSPVPQGTVPQGTVPQRTAEGAEAQDNDQAAPQGADSQSQPSEPAEVEPLRRAQFA